MSSAMNHKARSRRGYKMQRTILAPQQSPLVKGSNKAFNRMMRMNMFDLLLRKFMKNRKDET